MSEYIVVARQLAIAASGDQIQSWMTNFHHWVDWSPWEDLDPDLERKYSGPLAGVGARYEWSGNRKAGVGEMAIEAIGDAEIEVALSFTKPFKSESRTKFEFRPEGEATTVVWQVLTPKTLMLRVVSVFMKLDNTVGPDLERGLTRLKLVAEQGWAPAHV